MFCFEIFLKSCCCFIFVSCVYLALYPRSDPPWRPPLLRPFPLSLTLQARTQCPSRLDLCGNIFNPVHPTFCVSGANFSKFLHAKQTEVEVAPPPRRGPHPPHKPPFWTPPRPPPPPPPRRARDLLRGPTLRHVCVTRSGVIAHRSSHASRAVIVTNRRIYCANGDMRRELKREQLGSWEFCAGI